MKKIYNEDFTFPIKAIGPTNLIHNSNYYGDSRYTWDFHNHWPVFTREHIESLTGLDLGALSNGNESLINANLLKISRLSRSHVMKEIPRVSRDILEYLVAKSSDYLEEVLNFQIEIFQSMGGYESLYRVAKDNYESLGSAANQYFKGSLLSQSFYSFNIPYGKYRSDY